jgi:hypothetical protein
MKTYEKKGVIYRWCAVSSQVDHYQCADFAHVFEMVQDSFFFYPSTME